MAQAGRLSAYRAILPGNQKVRRHASPADGAAVVTFLVIVSRTRPDLHAYIHRVFFPDTRLQLVVDRRWIVRRRTSRALEKRTRRTSQEGLDLARHRLSLLLQQRARRKG